MRHVRGAFSREQADAMVDAVWSYVERHTDTRRDDTATWDGRPPVSFKRLKRNEVFATAYDNPAVNSALDGIFGAEGWQRPKPGAQILMTLPNAEPPWRLPTDLWHMDAGFGYRPTWPTFAVKLFACIADHEPGGGATLAISGSHLLVDQYTATLRPTQHGGGKEKWTRFMRSYPCLDSIRSPGDEPARTDSLMNDTHDAGGVPVHVVEMAGQAGDVFITHLHVFHCVAPNVRAQPRMMVAKPIAARLADDLVLVDQE